MDCQQFDTNYLYLRTKSILFHLLLNVSHCEVRSRRRNYNERTRDGSLWRVEWPAFSDHYSILSLLISELIVYMGFVCAHTSHINFRIDQFQYNSYFQTLEWISCANRPRDSPSLTHAHTILHLHWYGWRSVSPEYHSTVQPWMLKLANCLSWFWKHVGLSSVWNPCRSISFLLVVNVLLLNFLLRINGIDWGRNHRIGCHFPRVVCESFTIWMKYCLVLN